MCIPEHRAQFYIQCMKIVFLIVCNTIKAEETGQQKFFKRRKKLLWSQLCAVLYVTSVMSIVVTAVLMTRKFQNVKGVTKTGVPRYLEAHGASLYISHVRAHLPSLPTCILILPQKKRVGRMAARCAAPILRNKDVIASPHQGFLLASRKPPLSLQSHPALGWSVSSDCWCRK